VARKKAKSKTLKIILFSVLGLFAAALVAASSIGLYLFISFKNFDPSSMSVSKNSKIPVVPPADVVEHGGKSYKYNDDIVNVLFIGMDRDVDEIKYPDQIVFRGGQADVLILLSIDTKNKTYFLFNIYRDCMTEVAVYDATGKYIENKVRQIALAHAYGDGQTFSAELTEAAVSNLLGGIKIFRYIRFSVDGIASAADLFGGVAITLPKDAVILGKQYKAGEKLTMNGKQTESYLRSRTFGSFDSGIERSEKQLHFIRALLPQVGNRLNTDPLSIFDIYTKLEKFINTNLSFQEIYYVLETMGSGSDLKNVLQIPISEKKLGENNFVEFIVDIDKLYDIIVNSYYTPVD
jgi:LCP family protein required for cell wall assembly